MDIKKERAAFLAPAIRVLLAGGNPAIVTYRPNKNANEFDNALSLPYQEDIEAQYKDIETGIASYKQQNGKAPNAVVIDSLGAFVYGKNKEEADRLADGSITGALVEHQPHERLFEKISIVTGGAQGFGLGIAEEMTKNGAYTVLADLNYELADTNAKKLSGTYGTGRAIPVKVDVSNEESVKEMIYDTVLEYGGLDIFVNNAGVLKAGSLEEMDVASFEFVTKVNYMAYFICVKYASQIMKIQNRFDKERTMDIVQINSKSGLEGSNKNFAYAGGKFGGLGLTQSFALELTPYNIKVNSICPGNLLSGPLWTDPEKGLFVQYLRAGKVPGAKTVEDVRRFYESKVPMDRGCETVDVARALFYAVEQQYETGQAIPVTGGQIMLK